MITPFLKKIRILKIEVIIYRITRDDILSFPDLRLEIQNQGVLKGKKKYFVIENGILVHQSFVFDKVFLLKLIQKKGPVIGDCFTNPKYRGKSIYPYVIYSIAKEILVDEKWDEIFMIVNQDNLSSIKGIEKAGFVKQASINTKRWLWFYFDKNIIHYTTK